MTVTKLISEIKQKQIISQHMLQSLEILQLDSVELENYVEDLALENPVINLNETQTFNYEGEYERKREWLENNIFQNKRGLQDDWVDSDLEAELNGRRMSYRSLAEHLNEQLKKNKYSDEERNIIDFLIDSLDSRGYFSEDVAKVAEYFTAPENKVERLLRDIQELDPPGIGARDLKECLMLQLERNFNHSEISEQIVKGYLSDLAKNHLSRISQKLNVSMDAILLAVEEIRALEPKPGSIFSNCDYIEYVIPDVLIIEVGGELEIITRRVDSRPFTISTFYRKLYRDTNDFEVKKYLRGKLQQAEYVLKCIEQRRSTVLKVLGILMEKQKEFFLKGPEYKKPLLLAEIACELNLHKSTVSRAMKGKYLQCSAGLFPFNYFLIRPTVKRDD